MITAQDIREKTFEKSKFGGYDMAEVDDFLEELADDLTNTQKETSILKGKMKVLVDKIEEYRNNESALNQSILSAQKLAQQIEAEAKEKAEKMIADAEAQVQEKIGNITEKTAYEEKRLAAAQAANAKFLEGIRAMCNAQLKNIENISSAENSSSKSIPEKEDIKENPPVDTPPVKRTRQPHKTDDSVDETVRKIDEAVSKVKPTPSMQMDLDLDMTIADDDDSDRTQPFSI